MSNLKQTLIKRGSGQGARPIYSRNRLYHVMRWSWGFFPLFILSAVPTILPRITDDGICTPIWKVLVLAITEGIAVGLIASFTFWLERALSLSASLRWARACRTVPFLYFLFSCAAVIFVSNWWCNSVAYPSFASLNPIPIFPHSRVADEVLDSKGSAWNVYVTGKSAQQVADWYVTASKLPGGRLTWRLAEREPNRVRFEVLLDGAYYNVVDVSDDDMPGQTRIMVPAD